MVDQILARATQLPNDELHALYASIGKELEMRRDVEQAGDWKNLQDALTTYIRKWGDITITDVNEGNIIYLALGEYATTSLGKIEVGE